jgi:ADP-ribose pyrophosphatase YjhB (NUDIX family)
MAPGWYPPEHATTQAYGFCFTPDGRVVLVQAHDGFFNLPGGQLEPGETAADALGREVAEEASARVTAGHYLACQHVWDPQAPAGPTSHYQIRWWARVELEPWNPSNDEYVARRLVAPSDVLPTLSWQRKEIAGRLLNLGAVRQRIARAMESEYGRYDQLPHADLPARPAFRHKTARPSPIYATLDQDVNDTVAGRRWSRGQMDRLSPPGPRTCPRRRAYRIVA